MSLKVGRINLESKQKTNKRTRKEAKKIEEVALTSEYKLQFQTENISSRHMCYTCLFWPWYNVQEKQTKSNKFWYCQNTRIPIIIRNVLNLLKLFYNPLCFCVSFKTKNYANLNKHLHLELYFGFVNKQDTNYTCFGFVCF